MRLARTVVFIALTVSSISYAAPPCSVTPAPSHVFVPPPPYEVSPGEGSFYLGSDDFWTILPNNGVWDRRKIAWFSKDYWWLSQQESDLRVDGRKLDGSNGSVHVSGATNAFMPEHQTSAMLNSIEFPSTGCWEISAQWHGHDLKFDVLVTP